MDVLCSGFGAFETKSAIAREVQDQQKRDRFASGHRRRNHCCKKDWPVMMSVVRRRGWPIVAHCRPTLWILGE
jgi:hypothetical protein